LKDYLEFEGEMGVDEVPSSFAYAVKALWSQGDVRQASPRREAVCSKGAMLGRIREELGECRRCKLHPSRRTIVFGAGDPEARLVFVGEGPGRDEDIKGEPFVGRAGQLLTRMIESMDLTRREVYIANIIKCRPPGNRNPQLDEIATCFPFLLKQLDAIRPRIICALGNFAAQTLLETDEKITQLRGRFHSFRGTLLMPTYHPAFLLRNPQMKRNAWEDLKMIQREYVKERKK
jgi:DNA polymerase